jgi:ubiquinone/menaquinone biosynthesis C-methylase UbiE
MRQEKEWWNDFYLEFRPLFGILTKAETKAEANFIARVLRLKKGTRFLDCPCGIGRISIPLAKKGIRVTGVDITQKYLDEVAAKSQRLGLKINLVHGDMRRINFDRQFDVAGNIWTSFGYFEKESDNQSVLRRMFRALIPGGKFVLHTINRDWIIRNYTPVGVMEAGGVRVIEKRHFDLARSASVSEWIFLRNGSEKTVKSLIRLYSFHELVGMLRRAGFIDIEGFGSMKSDPITINSRMMFVVGTRPGKA